MSERARHVILAILVSFEGLLLALINFADMTELIGFGGGFGLVMFLYGLVEAVRIGRRAEHREERHGVES